jgi:hypothetical protein
MARAHMRILRFAASAVFWVAISTLTVVSARQSTSQSAPRSTGQPIAFFPPDTVEGPNESFFSQYLSYFGEPSLLAAAQDPNSFSYRFDALGGTRGYVIAIRLSLKTDGSAQIFISEQWPSPDPVVHTVVTKTVRDAPASDVKIFLQMVQRADFWSMRSIEKKDFYVLDADTWVFEGVRNGSYHVVLRHGPITSSFTDMVRFLTRNLAKLDLYDLPNPPQTVPRKHSH